jgi:hypothetical protein
VLAGDTIQQYKSVFAGDTCSTFYDHCNTYIVCLLVLHYNNRRVFAGDTHTCITFFSITMAMVMFLHTIRNTAEIDGCGDCSSLLPCTEEFGEEFASEFVGEFAGASEDCSSLLLLCLSPPPSSRLLSPSFLCEKEATAAAARLLDCAKSMPALVSPAMFEEAEEEAAVEEEEKEEEEAEEVAVKSSTSASRTLPRPPTTPRPCPTFGPCPPPTPLESPPRSPPPLPASTPPFPPAPPPSPVSTLLREGLSWVVSASPYFTTSRNITSPGSTGVCMGERERVRER